jgi:hypothetical protein
MQRNIEDNIKDSFLYGSSDKNKNFSTCGASANAITSICMKDIIDMFKKVKEIKKDRISCILVTNQPFVPSNGIFQKEYEGEKYIIMKYCTYFPIEYAIRNNQDIQEINKLIPSYYSFNGIPIYENDELLCRVWANIPSETFDISFKYLT